MRRSRGVDWRLLAAWVVTAGALVAFLVLTKLGHAVAGNLIGVLTALAAVYGTYLQFLQWRAGHPPALGQPDPSGLVVVCHARADLRWALWIEGRLDADGFSARLRRLPTGEDVAAAAGWAEQVAADCACVLVLVTPELERAGESVFARVRALAASSGGRGRLVLVRMQTAGAQPEVAGARTLSIAGIRREEEAWTEIKEAVRECGARSAERRAASFGGSGVVFPGLGAARANLPAANPNFVGREAELRQLREELVERPGGVEERCVALHAMSGMGKTQIAVAFVHSLGDFDTVWWIHAHQSAAISQDLNDLAQELRLPELADQNEQRRLLWERLRMMDRWLLVYDNAESEEKLRDLLPPAGEGSILITSRSPNWSALARRRIALEHMSEDDAVTLLRRRLPARDDQALAQIAEQLGWLPLALEQAASYMRETQCTPGRYLRQLSKRFSETLELGTQAYYDRSAGTTYRMARELVAQVEPLSGLLMELCGFFSPEAIPRDLFEAPGQAEVLPPELAAAVEAGLPYDTAVYAARKFSLLTVTTGSFSMHRVVQELIRDSLTAPLRRERADTAVQMLARLFPQDPDDVGTWEVCGALLSHCVTALREVAEHDLVSQASTRLSRLVGEYQRARGAFEPALRQLNTTLAQLRLHGGDESELAATELALARVHFRLADLHESKEHALIALCLHEAALGPEHQRTAANLLDLSQIRLELSEFDEALDDAKRSLAIRRSADGSSPSSPV